MSDKPRDAQEDILEQIITQGLSQKDNPWPEPPPPQKEPPQEEVSQEAVSLPPGEGGGTAHLPVKKDKRSAVYIYLVILFGAAFMMLLLAYFVQQRSSANALSSLRDSMNLSRQELLEQIESLERENESLRLDNDLHEYETDQARGLYEEQRQKTDEMQAYYNEALTRLSYAAFLEYLERFCHEQDYLMAAVMIEHYDVLFNEHNKSFIGSDTLLPAQAARYLELREEVIEKSGCMVLEQFSTSGDSNEYTERPYINAPSLYDDETLRAAHRLWNILWIHTTGPREGLVPSLADFVSDIGNLERLNGGTFQPSTVELFRQIIEDLTDREWLERQPDGSIGILVGNDRFIYLHLDPEEISLSDPEGNLLLTGSLDEYLPLAGELE